MSDIWNVRLTAARDAQNRSRYAFVAATIVAVAIGVAEFNSTLSWYSQFATQDNFPTQETRKEAEKTVVQEWIKSNRMTVSLLGVNFGMSDAPVLGSLSLSIMSLWFFVCIRRENHLIGRLLQDGQKNATETEKQTVFHGITGYLVFTTMSDDDDPISSLDQTPRQSKRFFLRPSIMALIYLPVLTIAFIVVTDVISWTMPPIIRDPGSDPNESLFFHLYHDQFGRFLQLMCMELFALVFGTSTFLLCRSIMIFEKATARILREFEEKYVPLNKPETSSQSI
jgi:hypothetical protein